MRAGMDVAALHGVSEILIPSTIRTQMGNGVERGNPSKVEEEVDDQSTVPVENGKEDVDTRRQLKAREFIIKPFHIEMIPGLSEGVQENKTV
jgi:hypothetical protein